MPCTALLAQLMRLPCLNARSSAYLRTWLLHSTVFRERCTLDFHATGLWLRHSWVLSTSQLANQHCQPATALAFAGGGGTCQMSMPCTALLAQLMRLPCLNARSSAYLRTWLLHSTVFREHCTLDFRATGLWLRHSWALSTSQLANQHCQPATALAFAGGGGTCQMSMPCTALLA